MDTDRMVSVQKVFGSMLCCFGAMLLRRRPRFRRFLCESDDQASCTPLLTQPSPSCYFRRLRTRPLWRRLLGPLPLRNSQLDVGSRDARRLYSLFVG